MVPWVCYPAGEGDGPGSSPDVVVAPELPAATGSSPDVVVVPKLPAATRHDYCCVYGILSHWRTNVF